ncbi:hypothetical protein ASE49_02855 [Novosphingobium sp. Leaf2]|nr:hypothetical protein ASE49_02855 [Novosphingobium sp. Leaf2]
MDEGKDRQTPLQGFAGGDTSRPSSLPWPSFDEDGALSPAQAEDLLFEDILELEGSLRASIGDAGGDAGESLDIRGIAGATDSVALRATREAGAYLRASLQALRDAAQRGNAAATQGAKQAMIDALTALRQPPG